MRLLLRHSESDRAIRAYSASVRTITNRGATTTGRHTNAAASAEDQNAWALTLNEMANDEKHSGVSKNQTHNMSKRMGSNVIIISSKDLKS